MQKSSPINRTLSVAPMLDWTDKHCRYFLRLISKNALLYTEMVTTGAIIHGKGDYLAFNEEEHPVALQLGGNDPSDMATCAKLAETRGYDEVNINVGCPSDRVQNGKFGACLMQEPETVAACVRAMKDVVDIPVTVKSRIGVDDQDSYEFLTHFVETVASAGCNTFIVHARKAWLTGLSPKQNREVPPLMYERVYQLKRDFPNLHVDINGGVKTLADCKAQLQQVDGVMLGREIYQNPYLLVELDSALFSDNQIKPTRHEIVEAMFPYIERHIANEGYIWHIVRHMLGLFAGQPGARSWRRHLSENANKRGADLTTLKEALSLLPETSDSAIEVV